MNDEHKELLRDILTHEGWNSLMLAINELTERQASLVLSTPDDKSTLDEKKRLEGMRRLQRAIMDLKKTKKTK
jgi:hypothetical protein